MPILKIQTSPIGTATASATCAVTFATPPVVGNAIILGIISSAGDGSITSVVDNKSNTYVLDKLQPPGIGTGISAIYSCKKIASSGASFTITVNSSPAADLMIRAIELNGEAVIDRTIGGAANTTAPTITTPTLTNAEVFVMQCISIWAAQTTITATAANPASPAWTEEAEKLTGVVAGQIDSRILTGMAGVATSCNWTTNPGGWCDYVLVAYSVITQPQPPPPTVPTKYGPGVFVRSPNSDATVVIKQRR